MFGSVMYNLESANFDLRACRSGHAVCKAEDQWRLALLNGKMP